MKKYKLVKLVGLIIIWGMFLAIGVFRLDPDFGWHVKMGEYIEKYGIPVKDPFTYTMPNFDFVDHEWLTNVLMWEGYRRVGRAGLAAGLLVSSEIDG